MPTISPALARLLLEWQEHHRHGRPLTPEQLCALKEQLAAMESAEQLPGGDATVDTKPSTVSVSPIPSAEQTTGDYRNDVSVDGQPIRPRLTLSLAPPGYELLSELGRGGMGVVYKALQVKAKRIVALKMILSGGHASQRDLERFRIEGESVARLQHVNIVQVFEVGDHDGKPYFALEFCGGGTLTGKLAGTPLPAREAAELVEKLARAIAEAHAKGIIHRDLKPANVLLTSDGEPKVTDFGLAKQLEHNPLTATLSPEAGEREKTPRLSTPSSPTSGGEGRGEGHSSAGELTATGAVMGTPSYMAPEQATGDTKRIGPPCDIYALGAVLYECLTGRPPFKGASLVETLDQVRNQEPVPPSQLNSKVPRDLETICLKCLRKGPEGRYGGAQDLVS